MEDVAVLAGCLVCISYRQIYVPLPFHSCCPSQTLLCWQILFPAGPTLGRQAQEISMGRWRALVMSKTRSISMLLESCHPLICPQHFTFICFKSTDMCLPVDWLWAISSHSGLVPLLCLGCVNGKIKVFFTRKSGLPGLLPSFFIVVVVVCFSRLANMTQFMTWMRYRGISYCSGLLLSGLVWSFPCVGVPSGLEAKLQQQGLGQRSAASGRGLSQTAEWYSCVSCLTMLEFAMDTAKSYYKNNKQLGPYDFLDHRITGGMSQNWQLFDWNSVFVRERNAKLGRTYLWGP